MTEISRGEILGRMARGTGPDFDTVARLLAARYSCRAFRPNPVPRAKIDQIVSLAQLSASWCNAQPWHLTITEGAGTERFRNAIYQHALANAAESTPDLPFPKKYDGVYGDRRRGAGWALYESIGIARGDRVQSGRQMLENFRLFGAPHVMFLTSEADLGTYGVLDCGLYLGNLLMLMQSAGIASIAQGAFAKHAPFIKTYFQIPEHRQLLIGISFGYAADDHPVNNFRTERADPDAAASWIAA